MENVDRDHCLARAGFADTSEQAFKTTPDQVRCSHRERIVSFIKAQGSVGATSEEVEIILGAAHQTIAARLSELHRSGQVHFGRERRKTSRGKNARVYFYGPPVSELQTVAAQPQIELL